MMLAGAPSAHADVVTEANAKAADVASSTPRPDRGKDDGHRPGLGIRGGQRHQRTLSLLSHEDHGAPAPRWRPRSRPRRGRRCPARAQTQQAVIEADYQAALKPVPDGRAGRWHRGGRAGGGGHPRLVCRRRVRRAKHVSTPHDRRRLRADDAPGGAALGRKPWVMTSGDQFRPDPPPSLTSDTWTRDLSEIKALGGRTAPGARRTDGHRPIWKRRLPPSTGRWRARSRPCPAAT